MDDMKLFQKKSGVKGIVKAVAVGAAVIVFALLLFRQFVNGSVEYQAELADLYAMRNAELAAALMRDNNELTADGYWFDPGTNTLIPDDEEKPSVTGLGTGRRGGAQLAFEKEMGRSYEYDESTDYTDKVIHLIAGDSVRVEWAPKD